MTGIALPFYIHLVKICNISGQRLPVLFYFETKCSGILVPGLPGWQLVVCQLDGDYLSSMQGRLNASSPQPPGADRRLRAGACSRCPRLRGRKRDGTAMSSSLFRKYQRTQADGPTTTSNCLRLTLCRALAHALVVAQPHAAVVLLRADDLGVRVDERLAPVGTVADDPEGRRERVEGQRAGLL